MTYPLPYACLMVDNFRSENDGVAIGLMRSLLRTPPTGGARLPPSLRAQGCLEFSITLRAYNDSSPQLTTPKGCVNLQPNLGLPASAAFPNPSGVRIAQCPINLPKTIRKAEVLLKKHRSRTDPAQIKSRKTQLSVKKHGLIYFFSAPRQGLDLRAA